MGRVQECEALNTAVEAVAAQDGVMSRKKGPRAGGPWPRRTFSPGQKLDFLARYERAVAAGEGGVFLRREGLYSSLMTQWRRDRDAGLLQGKPAGQTVGRPSAEQTEIARLRRELDQARAKLARTETALTIMGKARELLEDISRSEPEDPDVFGLGKR
jgi:transposase-like protein